MKKNTIVKLLLSAGTIIAPSLVFGQKLGSFGETNSIQNTSRGDILGPGSIAISNKLGNRSSLLNSSNGFNEKINVGGEYQNCNGKIKIDQNYITETKNVDNNRSADIICNSGVIYTQIPLDVSFGNVTNTGVGIVIENNQSKLDAKEIFNKSDYSKTNFSVYTSLSISNFDLGLKVTSINTISKEESDYTDPDNNNIETYRSEENNTKDSYANIEVSFAMKIAKGLRVASSISLDSTHEVTEERDLYSKNLSTNAEFYDFKERKVLAGSPLSFAIGSSYFLSKQNLLLTLGVERLIPKCVKIDNDQDCTEISGLTKTGLGIEMDLGPVVARSGISYLDRDFLKGFEFGLGADYRINNITLTSIAKYDVYSDESNDSGVDNSIAFSLKSKFSFNQLKLGLGIKVEI